ncbi:MAG: hypothetical protein ABI723_16575 [Bacteroidia bacterium]
MNSKKNFLIIIVMIAAFAGHSQNTVITRDGGDGYKYISDTLYLTDKSVAFRHPETKLLTWRLKSECKSVSFGNGLKISYSNQPSAINYDVIYNGNVNLVNGNLFTATILNITADKVSYFEPQKTDTLFISTTDIIEINYSNGVKEHFTSNNILIKPKEK